MKNSSSVYEAIEIHNEHVDKLQALGKVLLEQYSNIEETPVNETFCEVFNGVVGNAIYLCCEANELEGEANWMTTLDWHVIDKVEEHHDPEYIITLKLGKNSDVLVDIMDAGDMWESWLYRKDMGIKSYMFGWPKVQHSKSGKEEYYDLDAYIDMVCGNVEEYLWDYDEEFGDECDGCNGCCCENCNHRDCLN